MTPPRTISTREGVELIHKHGLYRLEIEVAGKRRGVAIVADGQIEVEDTLTREYGEWKLIRDKQAPA